MRMSAAKLAGVLVVGGALLSTTACGLIGGEKKAACDNIESELRSLTAGGSAALTTGGAETAQKWSDAAAKIRAEGQKAGGDVESAATRFAGDLENTATMLRNLSSGNLSSTTRPDTSAMMKNAQDLGKACGFANIGFRL
ncbi:hypothetical protein Arub01_30170 [Actinomadura rubrobrunea]|uniref:Small secreted protein n=1 Tax=Actinomadura rubrobrunea TaxID=115335 RepID=A0A9W6UW93_9ACTN|nr:hypothetical protein [Actinomadura rubrobrunea]GLW64773.1 hypothetical protein Arub01_30170 [Actinomadura rubrobrunea]